MKTLIDYEALETHHKQTKLGLLALEALLQDTEMHLAQAQDLAAWLKALRQAKASMELAPVPEERAPLRIAVNSTAHYASHAVNLATELASLYDIVSAA